MLWIIINCYNTTFLAHNLEILQVMGCKGVDIPGVHYQNPVHRCLADNGCPRCPPHGRDLTSVVGMGPAQHQGSVEPRGSWESPFALTLHLTTLLCNLRCFRLHADPPACLHFQGWDQSSTIPQNSLSGTSRRSLGQRNIHFAQRSCHVKCYFWRYYIVTYFLPKHCMSSVVWKMLESSCAHFRASGSSSGRSSQSLKN